jgi:hypothetical protein
MAGLQGRDDRLSGGARGTDNHNPHGMILLCSSGIRRRSSRADLGQACIVLLWVL